MGFLKFLGGFALVVLVLGGILFFTIGSGIFMMGKVAVEQANVPVEQVIRDNSGKIEIVVPIKEEYALEFNNIKLCKPNEEKDNINFRQIITDSSFGTGYSCINGACNLKITLEDKSKLPSNISIYTDKTGACKKEELSVSNGKVIIDNYEAKIEMTKELLAKLNISSDSNYKLKPKGSNNYSSWQIMGTKKLTIGYSKKQEKDSLLADDIEVATIIFK